MAVGDGVLGYWRFEEASWADAANEVKDSFPPLFAVQGRAKGGLTTNANGKLNRGASFDGSNDYITFGDQNSFDGLAAFSVAVWVKVASGDLNVTRCIFRKGDNFAFGGGWAARKMQFWVNTGTFQTSGTTDNIDDGNWHFIVGVWTGAVLKIFQNAVQKGVDVSKSGTMVSSSDILCISSNKGSGEEWKGDADEVCAWNRALTDAEITELHNSGNGKIITFPPAVTINYLKQYRRTRFPGKITGL